MKKQTNFLMIALAAILVLLNSCVSLKQVNELSESSLESVKKYESLALDFEKACLEHCRIDKLNKLEIKLTLRTVIAQVVAKPIV